MTGDGPGTPSRGTKRPASIFDAVAGRVGVNGFLQKAHTSTGPKFEGAQIPPDEVLFRRRGAPERYAEQDIYTSDRFLPKDQKLPDSDLLKTIHEYVSQYYARTTPDRGRLDFYSLDETALLAFGILLEETALEAMGKRGGLALAKPVPRDVSVETRSGAVSKSQRDVPQQSVIRQVPKVRRRKGKKHHD